MNTTKLDEALADSGGPHSSQYNAVTFKFPAGCKIMIDALVRILSVANQLYSNNSVCLIFDEKTNRLWDI